MIGLAVLCWATLAVLTATFIRMALRPDGGFGAFGRGRARPPRRS